MYKVTVEYSDDIMDEKGGRDIYQISEDKPLDFVALSKKYEGKNFKLWIKGKHINFGAMYINGTRSAPKINFDKNGKPCSYSYSFNDRMEHHYINADTTFKEV